jgi:hypothetical protein
MEQENDTRLTDEAQAELRYAYRNLEHPSFAARLSNLLASPIEEALSLLPKNWRKSLQRSTQTSVYRSLKLAMLSMGSLEKVPAQSWAHKLLAAGTGAVGGFFGPLTTLAELPVTTTLILRSIADIARSEGEDLSVRDTRVACVQVFALGGRTHDDEAADLGYYGLRLTLGLHFERGIIEYAAGAEGPHIPAFVELTRAIAARFGVVISDKAAAQMVPVAGALTGSLLNLTFMQHYQDVARGHFIVRRLEREYGARIIEQEYQRLEQAEREAEDFSPIEGW